MSIKYYDKSGATPEEKLLAGVSPVDSILNGTSKNAIQNKAVYNALKDKLEAATTDLINYYLKTDVYNKSEVRALIGAVETLTMEVVSSLPVSDISTTTIYLLKPTGSNVYDEYVYINDAWVKIGTTDMDLSGYMLTADFNVAIADYFTKAEINNLLNSYYTKAEIDADFYGKDAVDDLLDAKQDTLTFDSTPTADSSNPVTSNGIKTAIDAKKFSNPNLLDNGWFTVNQRGQTTYTNGYSLDRWSLRGTSKIDVISDGITFTSLRDDGANDSWIRQLISIEEASLLIGKTLTYSVLTTDGVITSWTLTLTSSNWAGAYKTVNGVQIRPTIEWGTAYVSILLWSKTYNVGLDIRAIKFEIGSESTLDLDTAPDYAGELAKCRASTVDSVDTFANQGSYFLSADNGILGAKNLLPNNGVGTSTDNGITYTKQSDGSVIANGTATGWAYYNLGYFTLDAGTYILNGKESLSGTQIKLLNADTSADIVIMETSEKREFTLSTKTYIHAMLYVGVDAGTVTNFVFYPMIRLASDTDSTYQPYAMTNRELTNQKIDLYGLTSSTAVWQGDTLTFKITPNNGIMYHLIAMEAARQDTDKGTFCEAYIIMRAQGETAPNIRNRGTDNIIGTWDASSSSLIITLPKTSFWMYRFSVEALHPSARI